VVHIVTVKLRAFPLPDSLIFASVALGRDLIWYETRRESDLEHVFTSVLRIPQFWPPDPPYLTLRYACMQQPQCAV